MSPVIGFLPTLLLIFPLLALLGFVLRARTGSAPSLYVALALSCGGLAMIGLQALLSGADGELFHLPIGLPFAKGQMQLDQIALPFFVIVNLAATIAALFASANLECLEQPRIRVLMPLFIGAMNGVLVSSDAFMFLFFWEAMSVASWLLVLTKDKKDSNRRAAYLYLVMAGAGTSLLLLSFGLLAGPDGAYSFAAMRGRELAGWASALIAGLALLGTASKAGLVPFHVWLPEAHPVAPSPISALMSGAMTKIALYGLLRILFDLLGAPPFWIGMVLVVLGALSALYAVLYLSVEADYKRLLAWSTIENLGLIAMALGLTVIFSAFAQPVLARLALGAALLLIINHALMKTLVFCAAGSVLEATGGHALADMGGLMTRMPKTAFLALIGAASLSAIPPLGGFAGEWMLLQSIFGAAHLDSWVLRLGSAFLVALLGLVAALALAGLVRAFGSVFLGVARTPGAEGATERPFRTWMALSIPAVLTLLVGIFPNAILSLFEEPIHHLLRLDATSSKTSDSLIWLEPTGAIGNSYSGFIVFIVVFGLAGLTGVLIHRFASNALRRTHLWACGNGDPVGIAQYSPSGMGQPLRRVFNGLSFRLTETVVMPPPGDTATADYRTVLTEPLWDRVYVPIVQGVSWIAERLNAFQYLSIRRYLAVMFSALVALLLLLTLLT
jgi:hydrogenase-4 component B